MSFDLTTNIVQMRTWFRYFIMLSSLTDIEIGDEIQVGDETLPVETGATNGQKIILNQEYMDGMSRPEQNFQVCRMIMAVARRQHLMRQGRDQNRWNIACEQVILNELSQYQDFLTQNKAVAPFKIPESLYIHKDFAGMSEAEVYNLLEEQKNNPANSKGKGNSKGNSGGGGGQCGKVCDGKNAGSPSKAQAESAKISRVLRSAEAQAAMSGKNDTFWGKMADDALPHGPDPEALLHRFVTNSLPTARTWKRPDPRILAMGQYYPGEIKHNLGELVVFLDCSGSMDRETVEECLSWTKNAVQSCKPEKIHIVYFTAEIAHVDVFRWNERFTIPDQLPNGGTDFAKAMKYLDNVRPKAAIWLTDGYDTFPEPPAGIPVLWLMTTDVVAPYGQNVRFYTKRGAEC